MEFDFFDLDLRLLKHRQNFTGISSYSFHDNVLRFGTENANVYLHELVHFFEHSSTPLGLFRDVLCRLQRDLLFRFLSEVEGKLYFPLYYWIRRLRKNISAPAPPKPELFFEKVDQYLRPWTAIHVLLGLLDGKNNGSFTYSEADAATLLLNTEALIRQILSGHDLGSGLTADASNGACPIGFIESTSGKSELQLGLLHVSESLAQVIEGINDSNQALLNEKPEYRFLADLVLEKLPPKILNSPKNGNYVAATTIALADLSLFSPIGPFETLRRFEMDWQDIHPSHRFISALEVVAEQGLWVSKLSDLEGLENEICDGLRWPRCSQFFEITNTIAIDGAKFLERYRTATEIRKKEFQAFYDSQNYVETKSTFDFFEQFMPIFISQGSPAVCGSPTHLDNHLELILDTYFARFTYQIMLTDKLELMPPEIPFPHYLENVEDLHVFRSLVEALQPQYSLSRFRQLY
jgi:hypothetical protein